MVELREWGWLIALSPEVGCMIGRPRSSPLLVHMLTEATERSNTTLAVSTPTRFSGTAILLHFDCVLLTRLPVNITEGLLWLPLPLPPNLLDQKHGKVSRQVPQLPQHNRVTHVKVLYRKSENMNTVNRTPSSRIRNHHSHWEFHHTGCTPHVLISLPPLLDLLGLLHSLKLLSDSVHCGFDTKCTVPKFNHMQRRHRETTW